MTTGINSLSPTEIYEGAVRDAQARQERVSGAPEPRPDRTRPKARIRLVMDRHQVRAILESKKTKHVRLVKLADPDDPDSGAERQPVSPGDRVPVQKVGKGEGVVCHVLVESVAKRKLGKMDVKEAKAHGFRTTTDYARAYMGAADHAWRRLSPDDLADTTDEEVGERWSRLWADRDVWVLTFSYDPLEEQRWLKASTVVTQNDAPESSDAGRGYTRNPALAARGEGPAVDDAALERYASDGRDAHLARRAEETAEQLEKRHDIEDNIVARFTETVAIARAQGVDPRHQIRQVRRALEALEQAIEDKHEAQRKAA